MDRGFLSLSEARKKEQNSLLLYGTLYVIQQPYSRLSPVHSSIPWAVHPDEQSSETCASGPRMATVGAALRLRSAAQSVNSWLGLSSATRNRGAALGSACWPAWSKIDRRSSDDLEREQIASKLVAGIVWTTVGPLTCGA